MKLSLVVLTAGKAAGQAIPIPSAQFIIGRDPQCNLRPASAMISKRHCAVLIKNNQVFLRDFGSTNGTYLNEQPVKGEVPLKDGDILKVGPLSFKVAIEGAQAPVKPTPPPAPKKSDVMDDDAAAMLLSLEEDGVAIPTTTNETEDAVPSGTTVMDMPAIDGVPDKKPGETGSDVKLPEPTPPAAKKGEPKKPATGAAQDAARAILEKLRQGRRK
jgi:pSer/pThr/pTyr-binding forkhead associated (FHA) protein